MRACRASPPSGKYSLVAPAVLPSASSCESAAAKSSSCRRSAASPTAISVSSWRAARTAFEEAQARLYEAETRKHGITKYRGLLWQAGAHALEPLVRDAFRLLGFDVETDPDKPGWVRNVLVTAFYEAEGASDTVVEWPYFRLQKRLEQDLLKTKAPKKGILVVNGQRLLSLNERTQPVSDTLRIAAENYRYALLTTTQLYDAIRAVLERPEDELLRATIRTRLLDAVGEVELV